MATAPRAKMWLNLKQQDGRITGTIRATQFFYTISESTGGPDRFTLTATMPDEGHERRATYEIIVSGNDLSVALVRNGIAGHARSPPIGSRPVTARCPLA